MQIKMIMTPNVEVISSRANLVEAAKKMDSLEVGALPVAEHDELVGIITDRDIVVRAIAERKIPIATRVSDIMSHEIFYCFEDDDITKAAKIMEDKSIHRLLVLSRDNEPAGFVSLADFAVKSRDEHLIWEILSRISEPASPCR